MKQRAVFFPVLVLSLLLAWGAMADAATVVISGIENSGQIKKYISNGALKPGTYILTNTYPLWMEPDNVPYYTPLSTLDDGVTLHVIGNSGTRVGIGVPGPFVQNGGLLTATGGENSSEGAFFLSSYTLNKGELQVTGTPGWHAGLIVRGRFVQNGGRTTVLANNGTGISLWQGHMTLNGGVMEVTAHSMPGISVASFTQNGGSLIGRSFDMGAVVALEPIVASPIGFTQNGGSIDVVGDHSSSLYAIYNPFIKTGGSLRAEGVNGGVGVNLYLGDFTHKGGTTLAIGNGGPGIYLEGGSFTQSGGAVTAMSSSLGSGVHLYTGDYTLSGGTLNVVPASSPGLRLEGGNFIQSRGVLSMEYGTQQAAAGISVSGSASFLSGSEVQLTAKGASATAPLLDSEGAINIAKGVTLAPTSGGLGFPKNQTRPLALLHSAQGITGQFSLVGSSATMSYTLRNTAQWSYLDVRRTAWASEALSGNNKRAVSALEKNADWLTARPQNLLNAAYSHLDSISGKSAKKASRGLLPLATLAQVRANIARLDMVYNSLFARLNDAAHMPDAPAFTGQDAYPETTASGGSSGWELFISPMARYDSFDTSSSSDVDVDGASVGFSAGAVKRFANATSILAGHFVHGRLTGSDYEADSNTFGLTAGIRTNELALGGIFHPFVQGAAGYSYTSIDQERKDMFGSLHTAETDQHALRLSAGVGQDFLPHRAVRLTPQLGIDYTYMHLPEYTEDGNDLRLRLASENFHSVRPYAGLEMAFDITQSLTLSGHGFYRYELADRKLDLTPRFANTPISYTVKSEKFGRHSGNAGVGFTWNTVKSDKKISLGAMYDASFGDRHIGHQFDVTLRWEF